MVDFYSSFVSLVPTSQPDWNKDSGYDQTGNIGNGHFVILIAKEKKKRQLSGFCDVAQELQLVFLIQWETRN